MNILAITGSLRTGSSNASLVRALINLAPKEITVKIYDGLGNLPLFSPDIDTHEPPPSVTYLREQIRVANAVIICTPEYAYGMPGALKNALDWLVSSAELYRKPVAALSASPSPRGGDRALAWLVQTLTALDSHMPNGTSFAISLGKEILEGDQIIDPKTVARFVSIFELLKDSPLEFNDENCS